MGKRIKNINKNSKELFKLLEIEETVFINLILKMEQDKVSLKQFLKYILKAYEKNDARLESIIMEVKHETKMENSPYRRQVGNINRFDIEGEEEHE